MTGADFRAVVRARPGARRTAVGGGYGEPPALVVAVTARAVDGAANAAVVAALAAALGVRRAQVRVVRGATARTKVIEVADPPEDVEQRWTELLGAH